MQTSAHLAQLVKDCSPGKMNHDRIHPSRIDPNRIDQNRISIYFRFALPKKSRYSVSSAVDFATAWGKPSTWDRLYHRNTGVAFPTKSGMN